MKHFCDEAKRNGLKYGWVDTCCIDKKSSAELSEAINSMFRWYADADVCYAYLCDVDSKESFANSQWFTRGWTLQEYLAPRRLIFYDRSWTAFGSRGVLTGKIQKITGIPIYATEPGRLKEYCVAERMSWASKRRTTRQEDMAYCLLGIFDINMPLLYGEGDRAFQRLQEEIMKVNADMSLFAWEGLPYSRFSLLASSPVCFDPSLRSIGEYDDWKFKGPSQGFTLNNAGISMTNVAFPCFRERRKVRDDMSDVFRDLFIMPISSRAGFAYSAVVIYLERHKYGEDEYFESVTINGKRLAIFFCYKYRHSISGPQEFASWKVTQLLISRENACEYRTDEKPSYGFIKVNSDQAWVARYNVTMEQHLSLSSWDQLTDEHKTQEECSPCVSFSYHRAVSMVGFVGVLTFAVTEEIDLLVAVGMDDHWNFICYGFFKTKEGLSNLNSARLVDSYLRFIESQDPDAELSLFDAKRMALAVRRIFVTKERSEHVSCVPGIEIRQSRKSSLRDCQDGEMFSYDITLDERELVRQSVKFATAFNSGRSENNQIHVPSKLLAMKKSLRKARARLRGVSPFDTL